MERKTLSDIRDTALALLKKFYGYGSFRPLQDEIIERVLKGGDVLVLMPTGGGKSVCFQIPALMMEGCTIVVSPLLSLMKDQVDSLYANGIPAAAINSMQSETVNREVVEKVFEGKIKLLYISPERLLSEINQWSSRLNVSMIAVDEAHCISQW
ncbi:MAG: DEAD/DEAH box helicase, partial [Bacteroidetes bacterium]|nr:DEAD/DEAH box helicase [Candidatus Limisoma faecipullorum]